MRQTVFHWEGRRIEVGWERTGPDALRIALPDGEREFRFRTGPAGALQLVSQDGAVAVWAVRSGADILVAVRGSVFRLRPSDAEEEPAGAALASPQVVAPMPGRVVKVFVRPGQKVDRGDPLLVLEAMKMETHIVAEANGKVLQVRVTPDAMVDGGQLLLELAYDSI